MLIQRTLLIRFAGFLLALFCLVGELAADEPPFIRHSARSLGMGGAGIAVADDMSVLFYNPAGLQSVDNNRLEILSAGISYNEWSEELLATEDSMDLFSKLVGKKIYADGDLGIASMVGLGWGYSIFTGGLIDVAIHNPTLPYFDVNAYYQTGMAYGESSKWSSNTDIGWALKFISRKGYVDTLHVSEIADANDIENQFSEKSTFGADAGLIYHMFRGSGFDTKLGLVARNIGGMDFGRSGGNIPMTLDSGLATTVDMGDDSILIAIDRIDFQYKGTEYKSTKRNLKVGVEYSLGPKQANGQSILAGRLGRNGEYLTWGFSVNYWGIKFDYANWSEEWGRYAGDKKDDRQSFQLSFIYTWGADGAPGGADFAPAGGVQGSVRTPATSRRTTGNGRLPDQGNMEP